MGTRATYLFEAGDFTPATCFYIHYDGYPEGAAAYFRAMLNERNTRGGMPCQFLRANALAEFTASHRAHGDTEYRYTVKRDGSLVVSTRVDWDKGEAGWRDSRHPSVAAFVNANRGDEPLFVFLPYRYGTGGVWKEVPDAIAHVEHQRLSAITYAMRFGAGGNADSGFEEFIHSAKALIDLGPDVVGEATVNRLRMQLHTLEDALASVKHNATRYYAMPGHELEALAAERGIHAKPAEFGRPLAPTVCALTAADYADEFGLSVVRVTYRYAEGWPEREAYVPVGCDVLAFLNHNETRADRMVTASMVRMPDYEQEDK